MAVTQQQLDSLAARLMELDETLSEAFKVAETLPQRIERLGQELAGALSPYKDQLAEVQGIAEAAYASLKDNSSQVDQYLDDLVNTVDGTLGLAEQSLPTGIASQQISDLTGIATDTRKAIRGTIDAASNAITEEADHVVVAIGEVDEQLAALSRRLERRTGQEVEKLLAAFNEAYVEPVRDATEEMVGTLRESADERVVKPLEQETERIAEQIGSTLKGLIDMIASRLAEFLLALRQHLLAGDEEAMARREEISEALDALKQAIPPLEAAFEAFAALAGVVGVSF